MKSSLAVHCLAASLAVPSAGLAAPGDPAPRPNIIIILADDMGYGDAGCYGSSQLKTPNLDKMATEGMRFTDFHSSGTVCSPTRAGLLTGRYQQRVGVPGVINADPEHPAHQWGLDPREPTFSKTLANAGYQTAIMGKWHLGYTKNFNPVHHGFGTFRGYVSGNIDYHSHYDRMGTYDWWDGLNIIKEPGYSTHLITSHAVSFIEKHKDQPFCLYVAHEAVHSPWQGPNDPPERGPDARKGKTKTSKNEALKAMMTEMDKGVGEVIAAVKEAGIAEHTLVFFFSDNGPAGGSAGPLRGRKGSDWEGGHRVPAIAWWPGKVAAATTNESLLISLDLMPTMLAITDTETPEGLEFDGVDFSPILFEGKKVTERQLFWNGKAMRDGQWKLMTKPKPALFDLKQDIGESTNLAAKYPERLKKMTDALEAWSAEVGSDQ